MYICVSVGVDVDGCVDPCMCVCGGEYVRVRACIRACMRAVLIEYIYYIVHVHVWDKIYSFIWWYMCYDVFMVFVIGEM